jgi:flagellar motility protein MotE (MotC chaperone)
MFCLKVRDKEEELENSLQKIDNLRQDIRKAEKLRRELEVGPHQTRWHASQIKRKKRTRNRQVFVTSMYDLQKGTKRQFIQSTVFDT